MPRRPSVFSIPASSPFLPVLASALTGGTLVPGIDPRKDPLSLAAATVFLPTRRAARALEYAILDALGTGAALLPSIVPLGDLDEDAMAFSEDQPDEEVLPAVSVTERRLVLARLVTQFAKGGALASSPASAIRMADELARLFDDLTTARIELDDLKDDQRPPSLDRYWEDALQFLKFAREGWRNYLAETGKLDPAERRDLLLKRKAADLRASKGGPFIAAGSTGTIPAVAELLVAISEREDGAVVLPGLDTTLDDRSFRMIRGSDSEKIGASFGHPQFGLSRLLQRLNLEREEVVVLGGEGNQPRDALLSEAFRPVESTDLWQTREARLPDETAKQAIDGLTLVEASDPREEALAAATLLRIAVQTPGIRAAFVTPDRSLARRVASDLRRWEIIADDSAGIPLAESEAGRFARLAAATAAEALSPVSLLAFLRHPMNRLSADRASIDLLELSVLRGPSPAGGAAALLKAIDHGRTAKRHRRDHRAEWQAGQWDRAKRMAEQAAETLAPLLALASAGQHDFATLISAHCECLSRCGVTFQRNGSDGSFELGKAFSALAGAGHSLPLKFSEYASAFAEILQGEPPVRREFNPEDRIRILGPLEARLLQADQILIGGLNEGTWPPEAHSDAWLNRPLRKKLKLDLPERRIGLTAHDFVQAIGMGKAVLTRSRKSNGVETVPSPFLQRLAAISPEDAWQQARMRGDAILSAARKFERQIKLPAIARPEPAPPADARPDRLSVTDIETLIRDPYSIYARDVLGLSPIDELEADPGAAERGTILHRAFDIFTREHPGTLPADAFDRLLEAGRTAFEAIEHYPELRAIWWPRFERAAEWLLGEEVELRARAVRVFAEASGAIRFDAGGREFTLTARADRLDLDKDGAVTVMDYKTGAAPSLAQMMSGLAPQLSLEAAIAQANGFANVPGIRQVGGIAVISISGGVQPGKITHIDPAKSRSKPPAALGVPAILTCADLARIAREQTEALIRSFADPKAPYQSVPRPKWSGRFGRYDHLARIKEWSANERGSE